jgi:hypothetical protein
MRRRPRHQRGSGNRGDGSDRLPKRLQRRYATTDRKKYGICNWYVGDGGLPADKSYGTTQWVFYDTLQVQ